jgi:D-alanyl-D-alanine dipeptidase
MTSPADNARLLAAAGQALSRGLSATGMPIPVLMPEPAALSRPAAVTDHGEPLAQIPAAGIDALHSYLTAGRRHATDRQWLRTGTLARLQQAAAALPSGLGIAVFDAWRPLALQQELFEAVSEDTGPDGYSAVAPPSADPQAPPPHLTGGAVDLTLTWQGEPLELGTAFDEFTELARTQAFEDLAGPVRSLRRVLYHALREQDFVVLAEEWWHFEFGTRLWAALTGRPALYGPTVP